MAAWFRPLALASGLLLPSTVALAGPYDDFRIPDHHWRTLRAGVSAGYQGQDHSGAWDHDEQRSLVTMQSAGAQWGRDSDRLRHLIALSLDNDLRSDRRESHEVFPSFLLPVGVTSSTLEETRRISRWAPRLNGSASARFHPGSGWIALVGSAGVFLQDDRSDFSLSSRSVQTDESDPRPLQRDLHQDTDRRISDRLLDLSISPAIGRVRDATSVFRARLLLDRLDRDRRLIRPIRTQDVHALAERFFLQTAYSQVHDQPDKAFWSALESWLESEGLLDGSGMDAWSLLHGLEAVVVAGGRVRHDVGASIGPTLTSRHHRSTREDDWSSSDRLARGDSLIDEVGASGAVETTEDQDDLLWGVAAEWHRPVGMRTQVDASFNAYLDTDGTPDEGRYQTQASVVHLVGERWAAWGTLSHDRQPRFAGGGSGYWGVHANAGIAWYLEDHWSLGLDVNHLQDSRASDFYRGTSATLRVDFRRGALDAPGLIDPVRPLN